MSQLERFCKNGEIGIKFEGVANNPFISGMPKGSRHYKVTLTFEGREITTHYSQGSGIRNDPQPADVLYCLLADSYALDADFANWAREFDMDPNGERTHKLYDACRSSGKKAKTLLGIDLFEHARNLEH